MTYPITGIQVPPYVPGGPVPLRLDVDRWYQARDDQSVKQVKLFLLALLEFQQVPVEEQLSYFQIAGIHGYPQKDWDGVEKPVVDKDPNNPEGYCTHNSILFPSFHRPYLLLFEQQIYNIMVQSIIPGYTQHADQAEKQKWVDAAQTWRFPYWDWGVNVQVPLIANNQQVDVEMPDKTVKIDNPMFKFKMPGGEPMKKYGVPDLVINDSDTNVETTRIYFGESVGTSRCPGVREGPKWVQGDVRNEEVPASINRSFQSRDPGPTPVKDSVSRLLTETYFKDYKSFSTTFYYKKSGDPNPKHYLSVEGIHNLIHNGTGGFTETTPYIEGHMTEVPWAAFDPIFWMHHCNVDRLYAIWQDLNPDLWWTEDDQGGLPSSFLKPFHTDSSGQEWNSDKQRNWVSSNYSYPELQRWLPKYIDPDGNFSEDLYKADVTAEVQKLYGAARKLALAPPSSHTISSQHRAHLKANEDPTLDDYIVNVLYRRFALDGASFTVTILLAGKEVGSVYNFCSPLQNADQTRSCANCLSQKAAGALATGQVPISLVLATMAETEGGPPSLATADLESWLQANLRWKVTAYGREIDLTRPEMKELRVSVAVGKAKYFRDGGVMTTYHDYRVLNRVTNGRRGGLSLNESI